VNNAYAAGALDAMADIAGWLASASDDEAGGGGSSGVGVDVGVDGVGGGGGGGGAVSSPPGARRAADFLADAAALRQQASALKASMRAQLLNNSLGAFRDGKGVDHYAVHASAWSAAFGVVTDDVAAPSSPEALAAAVTARLNATQSDRLHCSCMGAFWVLRGLYAMGVHHGPAADLALQLLVARSPTSWLSMMDDWNATAAMEAWSPSDKPNLSFSHPWCSAPNSVVPRLLLGVQPTGPRWVTFQVRPQPSALAHANATLPTPQGTVALDLTQAPPSRGDDDDDDDDDVAGDGRAGGGGGAAAMTLRLVVPVGTEASVCLPPVHASFSGRRSGRHGDNGGGAQDQLQVDGQQVAAVQLGRLLCAPTSLAPGAHVVVRA
jgi:hypothetical protein